MHNSWGESCLAALSLSVVLLVPSWTSAQISSYPYTENFDSSSAPSLPAGWTTSSARLVSGDFFTTTTSPRSRPNALQSTNSAIEQSVVSPRFDFRGKIPSLLQFYSSRSGTHTSPVLVEASLDDGATFPILLGDTLLNPGSTAYFLTSIPLPETFFDQPMVRFRWHVLGGAGGTAGTFRIDDITLETLRSFDLSLSDPLFNPQHPTSADPVVFTVTVTNGGKRKTSGYFVDFFLDTNGNGTGDPPEQFGHIPGIDLEPGDSTLVLSSHAPLHPGEVRWIAAVDFTADEQRGNDTIHVTVPISFEPGTIVVNEIMYAPLGDEPEWVELFNTSADTVDLKNWRISDSNTNSKSLLTVSSTQILPSSYAVVTKDPVFLVLHPEVQVPVLISPFSALNNTTPDAVALFDPWLTTIDSVRYFPGWGGQNGISLERIDAFASPLHDSNWSSSRDSSGSTPGRVNSIAKLDDDLALVRATVGGWMVTIDVRNIGRNVARSFAVDLVIQDSTKPFDSISFEGLLRPDATVSLEYEWKDPPSGESKLLCRLRYDPDRRFVNDTVSTIVSRSFAKSSVIINEIMYEPAPGQNEWVELLNRSDVALDISHWSISSGISGASASFALPHHQAISAHGYCVIAADSTILALRPTGAGVIILNKPGGLSLGNDGDDVVLKDLTGAMVDSVSYRPSWHTPDVLETRGRSLERIDPDHETNDVRNWGTSAAPAGSSPCERNSLFAKESVSSASLSVSPNPFSPDGDGHEDVTIVSYRLPASTSVLRVRIFDRAGRLIQTLADSAPGGSSGEFIWDGFDSEGRRARVGPYVLFLEAVDNRGATTAAVRGVIIVATKL